MKKQVLVDGVAYDAEALELFADIAHAYSVFAELVGRGLESGKIFIDRHEINIISECDNACIVVEFIGKPTPFEAAIHAENVVKLIDNAFLKDLGQ